MRVMSKISNLSRVLNSGIVAIIRADDGSRLADVALALVAGGVEVMEVTFTVPKADRVLETVADRLGDKVLLGAGTVLDPETARACLLAGAEFLVTPSLSVKTIEVAKRYSKVMIPGALTPTEVLTAWEAGADAVKIFPCSAVGGAKYIKALRAPFPHIEMVPTGGVNLETVADFLRAGACAVGVGGELIDSTHVREGRFEVFEERARRFLEAIAKTRELIRAAAH